jgi:hypothetical protein
MIRFFIFCFDLEAGDAEFWRSPASLQNLSYLQPSGLLDHPFTFSNLSARKLFANLMRAHFKIRTKSAHFWIVEKNPTLKFC